MSGFGYGLDDAMTLLDDARRVREQDAANMPPPTVERQRCWLCHGTTRTDDERKCWPCRGTGWCEYEVRRAP